MARRYIVDFRHLSKEERTAAFEQIDRFAFMTTRISGKTGLEGADVIWSYEKDFPTSPAFPAGCPYREVK